MTATATLGVTHPCARHRWKWVSQVMTAQHPSVPSACSRTGRSEMHPYALPSVTATRSRAQVLSRAWKTDRQSKLNARKEPREWLTVP